MSNSGRDLGSFNKWKEKALSSQLFHCCSAHMDLCQTSQSAKLNIHLGQMLKKFENACLCDGLRILDLVERV